jgi:hypothetical protein
MGKAKGREGGTNSMTKSTFTMIACLTSALFVIGCASRGKVTVAVRDAVTSQPIAGARVSSYYPQPMFSMIYAPRKKKVTNTNGIARLQSNLSGGSQLTIFGRERVYGPIFVAKAAGYRSATNGLPKEQFAELRKRSHRADDEHPDLVLHLKKE